MFVVKDWVHVYIAGIFWQWPWEEILLSAFSRKEIGEVSRHQKPQSQYSTPTALWQRRHPWPLKIPAGLGHWSSSIWSCWAASCSEWGWTGSPLAFHWLLLSKFRSQYPVCLWIVDICILRIFSKFYSPFLIQLCLCLVHLRDLKGRQDI